jgi:hypothetical protein
LLLFCVKFVLGVIHCKPQIGNRVFPQLDGLGGRDPFARGAGFFLSMTSDSGIKDLLGVR